MTEVHSCILSWKWNQSSCQLVCAQWREVHLLETSWNLEWHFILLGQRKAQSRAVKQLVYNQCGRSGLSSSLKGKHLAAQTAVRMSINLLSPTRKECRCIYVTGHIVLSQLDYVSFYVFGVHFCISTDLYSQNTLFNLLILAKAQVNIFTTTHLLQWDFNLAFIDWVS